jgi:23S rRNA (cytidine1920-2'-O)/16S rRNA (cytidine1409-2'-O)-methyltransferase
VRRGLVPSREHAQAAIAQGRVLVGGAVADRASRLVSPAEPVEVRSPPRFVSRGGEKLAAALDRFRVDVTGRVALDAGASTGGFTDCLLASGATRVIAVDVGHGQLHPRLRSDPRVVVLERTNVRHLDAATLREAAGPSLGALGVDVVTADLSFISLTTVARALTGLVHPGGELVLLVKPQFEVGRVAASRCKGVVRDPALWLESLRSAASRIEGSGAAIMDAMRSPLTGASGNTEFFVLAVAGRPPGDATDELLRAAVSQA